MHIQNLQGAGEPQQARRGENGLFDGSAESGAARRRGRRCQVRADLHAIGPRRGRARGRRGESQNHRRVCKLAQQS